MLLETTEAWNSATAWVDGSGIACKEGTSNFQFCSGSPATCLKPIDQKQVAKAKRRRIAIGLLICQGPYPLMLLNSKHVCNTEMYDYVAIKILAN